MRLKHWKRFERLCDLTIKDIKDDLGQVYLWMDVVLNHGSQGEITQYQLTHDEQRLLCALKAAESKKEYSRLRAGYAWYDGRQRNMRKAYGD
jgi:hypothetical protein